MKTWFINVLIGIDQLFTAILGGWPDETLSSYAYRLNIQGKRFGFMRNFIDWLFFWQEDHCYFAYLSERDRTQQAPALRKAPSEVAQ